MRLILIVLIAFAGCSSSAVTERRRDPTGSTGPAQGGAPDRIAEARPAPPPAVAEETAPTGPSQAPGTPGDSTDPCDHVATVCKAAGYTGKTTQDACVRTVLTGSSVEGVQVDPIIRACVAVGAMQVAEIDGSGQSACDDVLAACKQAGYYQDGFKEHKGIWWNCVIPLLSGDRSIAVAVAPGVLTACVDSPVRGGTGSPFLPPAPPAPSVSGLPDLPNTVTSIPFYSKKDETPLEKTKVVITAEVDGLRGNFVVDLGAAELHLNRTFLQPSSSGGVEAITDANRVAEGGHDTARVTMRLGTMVVDFDDPMILKHNPKRVNAVLDHMWGNYSWVFAPRLGNISLSVLEPFETILDYIHQRVVLIRLDPQGRRMAKVPAYTPRWSTQLFDMTLRGMARRWWGVAVRSDGTLDTRDATNNIRPVVIDSGAPKDQDEIVGYPFLSHLGVVGFNHRTHQFILYKQ